MPFKRSTLALQALRIEAGRLCLFLSKWLKSARSMVFMLKSKELLVSRFLINCQLSDFQIGLFKQIG